jgi:NAD(P)-dependent dehydrogenase (short-subunit alcohol dehydrogenase family)
MRFSIRRFREALMRFKDKVVVITGAGSGIGRAMVTLFSAEGAKIVAGEVVADRLESLLNDVRATGGEITGVLGSVAVVADAERLIDMATSCYGRIDVLCNNAGIMDAVTPVAELSDELWRRVLGVNLDGAMFTSRRALPIMVKQGGGVILNTASVAAIRGGVAGAAYTTSKHALIGLTKSIAWQYATKGVRCAAILPGGVETAIGLGGEPNATGWGRMEPLLASSLRAAKPEEIARVALFLASEDASFVNGVALVADGGWTAG